MVYATLRSAVLIATVAGVTAHANEFQPQLEALAESEIATIVANPMLVEAIRAQNAKTAGMSEDDVVALDQKWRAEVGSSPAPTIDSVLDTPASEALRGAVNDGAGVFTEIFVMDAVGLNVASSDVTSDYWQGDEAKWQETFAKGPGAMHFGEIELDESTQTYQSQVSVAITDPETNAVIGAATFGVNVEMLN